MFLKCSLARQTNLTTAHVGKNKRTSRIHTNASKDHSILIPYNWTPARSVRGTRTVRNDQRHPYKSQSLYTKFYFADLNLMSATVFIGRQLRKHHGMSTARAVAIRGSLNL